MCDLHDFMLQGKEDNKRMLSSKLPSKVVAWMEKCTPGFPSRFYKVCYGCTAFDNSLKSLLGLEHPSSQDLHKTTAKLTHSQACNLNCSSCPTEC